MGNENDLSWVEVCYHFPRKEKTNKRNKTKTKTKKQKKNSSLCIESYFYHSSIGHFGKYHNTLCLSPPNFAWALFPVSLATYSGPERKQKQYLIWEDKQRVWWYFSNWPIEVSFFRPRTSPASLPLLVRLFMSRRSFVRPSAWSVRVSQPCIFLNFIFDALF